MTTASAPIEIFRAGRHTAVDGSVHDFSVEDLQAAVAGYDFANEPAPMVVGHPKLNEPAYGWAGGLVMDGDKVVADPHQVEPAFAELVNKGRFKRVSASWYPKDHPSNPTPGRFYLRHIGFLGAAAPAVRGLRPVSFSEAQTDGLVTIDLDLKEAPVPEDRTAEFAEREAAIETKEAAIAEREADVLAREATVLATERQAVHDGHVVFAEAQVAAGRLAPAGKALVIGVLDHLATAGEPINFGEADGELAPVAAFQKLFEGAQPIVQFGEAAPDNGEKIKDAAPADIATKALAFAESEKAAGRTITVQAAVRQVMKDQATA